ncbi:hypothetical protein O6H91_20G057300 [Diphasiastrum complanatum]|uniref:Uncharacterized protein n=2 Tax=Diphasiastrum complanatum TaxID=34168 RepID=A0ACC2AQF4_DIPCM|nr:hypothetical protein O6H91_20G010600 [Diphasiastrum complanatum]KAJ7519823.1 hypothetical protein O6H91_20G057300 [Diphasiastrum complanatum]
MDLTETQSCVSSEAVVLVKQSDFSSKTVVPEESFGQSHENSDRSKTHVSYRRKVQQKRVVYVPMKGVGKPIGEVLPSDTWAWRKYGQKPIKGSPYPRAYYRCSSSKGCSARKQVEQSITDPSMLIISYTSEHNHPWPAHCKFLSRLEIPDQNIAESQNFSCIDSFSSSTDSCEPNLMDPLAKHSIEMSARRTSKAEQHMDYNGSISKSSSEDEDIFENLDNLPELSSIINRGFQDHKLDDLAGCLLGNSFNTLCMPPKCLVGGVSGQQA